MNKEEIQEVLDELHIVRPEMLNEKAKRLFEAIMKIADERDRLNKALLDIKEILKKQSISLDWEPWSTYQVSGQKLFDIAVILDKVLGSDIE